ncbi:MAG: PGAP1 family protein, partial [Candidatus Roizmanbacteria bacterium GW2011_GWA2_32_13]
LHNKTVSYNDWKLLSFIKDYGGLIKTLKAIGYQENTNLFLFTYDWRQSIEKTIEDLNSYLQTKIWNSKPNQKLNLIGHSLGGLVARIFTQKNIDKVNKIISVGSPHLGAVQVYKPLEAGEIDRENTFLWVAEKIILILNKPIMESDRVTIATKFPVTKDLFPTFNFLKESSGNEISIDNLTIKNSFLLSYNQNFSNIFPIFIAFYGEKDNQTPAGFIIQPADTVNQLLGNYTDGQPKSSLFDAGDYTVLSKSANKDSDSIKLNFDHEEIITKKESIKKILDVLKINYSDNQIVEGEKTIISPSLIFLIKSPATMMVEFNNSIFTEDEGIIFIPDAQSGSYDLKVQGVDQGKYEIIVGQISENNDIWDSINGEITKSPASSQIDNHNIIYNNQTALSIFPTPTTTITSTITPVPTELINQSLTVTPTTVAQSTNSTSSTNSSSNNEILISKESSPAVLGISSSQEELISPTIEVAMQTETKKEIKKSLNIWDYIWPSTISLILGGVGWLFRKKFLKK